MKKLFCMLLCLLVAVAVLAGCTGPQGSDKPTVDLTVSDEGVHYDENGELVCPKHEGVTLTVGVPIHANCTDYDNNYFTNWLEEHLGIQITFVKYGSASADYQKQISTDTASGNPLPDVLLGMALGQDTVKRLGEDGYFLDLSDYLENETKSEIFLDRMEQMSTDMDGRWEDFADRVWRTMRAQDVGEEDEDAPIYGLPKVNTSLVDYLDFMPYINTEWLRKVNMDMPKTIDELEAVLRAFNSTDCNGNGFVGDEIPLIGCGVGQRCGDVVAWLLNFELYYNDEHWFNIDENGKLYMPHLTDEYRKALSRINRWMEEGLLNPNSLTYDSKSIATLLTSGDYVGVMLGMPSNLFAGNTAYTRFEVMDLFGYTYYNDEEVSIRNFITDSCQNVDAAYDFMMLFYTWESCVIQRYGEQGVDWDIPAEGTMSGMGIPATVKIIDDIVGKPTNSAWGTSMYAMHTFDTFDLIDTSGATEFVTAKWDFFGKTCQYYEAARLKTVESVGAEKICPWLNFNEEEDQMAPNRVSTKNDINAWRSRFIDGSEDIDNDATWARYLQEINAAQAQNYIDAAQHCYDRMYPNGHVN